MPFADENKQALLKENEDDALSLPRISDTSCAMYSIAFAIAHRAKMNR